MEDNAGAQKNVEEEEDEIIESDIELEGETVKPDNDLPQKMGDRSVEVTDEKSEASREAKAKAVEAISEGKLEEVIDHLTEAILQNPTSAIMYATRASVHVKMKKPNPTIRDANVALEVEPNAHRIEEHRRKYERLQKEREDRNIERERSRRRTEAKDPELMAAFSGSEVMAALQDVMKNPDNLAKHEANPKVAPIIAKMMSKFGGPE